MSFLARVNTVHATASALSVTAVRSMSLTARLNRGPVGAARDTLRKADRTVAGAAVKGIEKGEKARDKLKDAVQITNKEAKFRTERMKGDAAEVAGQGGRKAEEALGESSSTARGLAGKTG